MLCPPDVEPDPSFGVLPLLGAVVDLSPHPPEDVLLCSPDDPVDPDPDEVLPDPESEGVEPL